MTAKQPADDTVTLFRPVGRQEFSLIAAGGFRAFPPCLSFQPIFYPVVTEAYATRIARDWNTCDEASGFVGYVTRFRVRTAYLQRYELHTVGNAGHQEYWIPAEDLAEFNHNLRGPIEVIAEFHVPPEGG